MHTDIAPTFTNLPTTKSYVDKTPSTTIMAVSVTDDNTGDLASLSTAIATHCDKFDIASSKNIYHGLLLLSVCVFMFALFLNRKITIHKIGNDNYDFLLHIY